MGAVGAARSPVTRARTVRPREGAVRDLGEVPLVPSADGADGRPDRL